MRSLRIAVLVSVSFGPLAVLRADDQLDRAMRVTVSAKAHSVTGGSPLVTGFEVVRGETLRISVDPKDKWSAGSDEPHSRTSNAGGLVRDYPPYGHGGLTAPFGSLVGRIGDGKFFLVGTSHTSVAAATGPLRLYFWDQNAYDNSGSVRVRIAASGGKCDAIKSRRDALAKQYGLVGMGRTLKGEKAANRNRINGLLARRDDIEKAIGEVDGGIESLKKQRKRIVDEWIFDPVEKSATKVGAFAALQALKSAASKRLLGTVGVVIDAVESGGKSAVREQADKAFAAYLKQNRATLVELLELHGALSSDLKREYALQDELRLLATRLESLDNRWADCVNGRKR